MKNKYQFFQVFCKFVGGMGSYAKINFILKRHIRIIAVVKHKRYMVNTYILSIIICKFCFGQELCPIVMFLIEKNMQINFYFIILSLGPAVCLWIKCSGELLLNAEELI